MDIGINVYSKWPYEEVIAAFLENGICRTFVCIDHPQFDSVMKELENVGIKVDNLHAPFKGQNAIWEDGAEGEKILKILCNGIDCCVEYNVKAMIVHASSGRPMPEITDIGLKRFDKLMEYAEEKGVTIAFESHRYWENVSCLIKRYPKAGFCYDCDHEHAFTPGVRYMPMCGNRLVATHISDNDCLCDKDMHMLPFDGIIDFDRIARDIAEYGNDVTLMLEIKPDNHERYRNMSIKEYYSEATKRIIRLEELVSNYKKLLRS